MRRRRDFYWFRTWRRRSPRCFVVLVRRRRWFIPLKPAVPALPSSLCHYSPSSVLSHLAPHMLPSYPTIFSAVLILGLGDTWHYDGTTGRSCRTRTPRTPMTSTALPTPSPCFVHNSMAAAGAAAANRMAPAGLCLLAPMLACIFAAHWRTCTGTCVAALATLVNTRISAGTTKTTGVRHPALRRATPLARILLSYRTCSLT